MLYSSEEAWRKAMLHLQRGERVRLHHTPPEPIAYRFDRFIIRWRMRLASWPSRWKIWRQHR